MIKKYIRILQVFHKRLKIFHYICNLAHRVIKTFPCYMICPYRGQIPNFGVNSS